MELYEDEQGQKAGTYLFNLALDPKEKDNLAEQDPERVAQLKLTLNARWNPARERHDQQ